MCKIQPSLVKKFQLFKPLPASVVRNVTNSDLNFYSFFAASIAHFVDIAQEWQQDCLNKQSTGWKLPVPAEPCLCLGIIIIFFSKIHLPIAFIMSLKRIINRHIGRYNHTKVCTNFSRDLF